MHLLSLYNMSTSARLFSKFEFFFNYLAREHAFESLSTAGQNESGVAVHDDRIYVVGGYSIWTNEPLACIQVSGSDPRRPRHAGATEIRIFYRQISPLCEKFETVCILDPQKKKEKKNQTH